MTELHKFITDNLFKLFIQINNDYYYDNNAIYKLMLLLNWNVTRSRLYHILLFKMN